MAKRTKQTDTVANFQNNLTIIRMTLGMGSEKLGKYLGLTKQAVWNMENHVTVLSIAQYIAIRHLFDHVISKIDDPDKQLRCKKVIALLVDNAEDTDYDWTEEIIRQLTEEEE